MDWNAKGTELRAATIAAFDELVRSLQGERLYTICLQTADDGMSVGLSANTEEGHAGKKESEAEFEEMTSDYEAYLRWAPAEWRYEMFGDAHFENLNGDLAEAVDDLDEPFETFFELLLDAMTGALAHLRSERSQGVAGVTLFVTISDSEDAEAVEQRSAIRLNPHELASDFVARLQ